MEIILMKDVENLGLEGEIKKVRDGYARNFLLPRKLAVVATPQNLKGLSLKLKILEDSRKKKIATASEKKKMLEDIVIGLKVKAGEKGRLFGSITTAQIAEKLGEMGFSEVDKKQIRLPHIKEVGDYHASVKLIESVSASIRVRIEAEAHVEPKIEPEAGKKTARRPRAKKADEDAAEVTKDTEGQTAE